MMSEALLLQRESSLRLVMHRYFYSCIFLYINNISAIKVMIEEEKGKEKRE